MKRDCIEKIKEVIHGGKLQKVLILMVVYTALLLDNLLGLVIIPIIPIYLKDFEQQDADGLNANLTIFYNQSTYDSVGNASNMFNGYSNSKETFKNPRAGILFASKSAVQVLAGPIVGALTDRVGYNKPMIVGLLTIFVSTMAFAFGSSFPVLVIARSVQGVGSALCAMSGFALLADRFSEQSERSKYQGIAIAFISFGCSIAPPYGGILHKYFGRKAPFLSLAVFAALDCFLMLFVKPSKAPLPKSSITDQKATPIYYLIIDLQVIVCVGGLFMGAFPWGLLEPTIGPWMNKYLNADEFQTGIIWLPSFFVHLLGVMFVIRLIKHCPKYLWICVMCGLLIQAFSSLSIGYCKHYILVMLPVSTLSFGIALVETSLFPHLGHIVDTRYVGIYGSIYAIADISLSLSYALGPLIGDVIYQYIGFLWLNVISCICSVLYSPSMFVLRKSCERSSTDYKEINNQ